MLKLDTLRWIALAASVVIGSAGLASRAEGAATVALTNGDGAGEGFNDPNPRAPVGGNPGTSLGQQRQNAVQHAFNIWGAVLNSVPAIFVLASFDALVCPTQAVGVPTLFYRNFAGAPRADTWFPAALANRNSGADLAPGTAEIRLTMNVNFGGSCLPGQGFYYGLDGNHGSQVDLVTVVLHELAHGLGFYNTTSLVTGAYLSGFPSMFDVLAFDTATNKLWVDMSNAERVTSARNARRVVWTGANVTAAVPVALTALGTPRLVIAGPAAGAAAGTYVVGGASFGAPLGLVPVTGQLMPVADQGDGSPPGCNPLDPLNTLAVSGEIALIEQDPSGVCTTATQAANAETAGALAAVIFADTFARPPPELSVPDPPTPPTVTIPVIAIARADGLALSALLARRSRTRSGVTADVALDGSQRLGADTAGRALLFTSDPTQNIAHWDTTATPNQLLEPVIGGDVSHSLFPSNLAYRALQDIGW